MGWRWVMGFVKDWLMGWYWPMETLTPNHWTMAID
jgi:hypothetical protein